MDPGHMSPMLYGILALTGRYSMDELKEFRQWGSVTPGHPELDVKRGVDNMRREKRTYKIGTAHSATGVS